MTRGNQSADIALKTYFHTTVPEELFPLTSTGNREECEPACVRRQFRNLRGVFADRAFRWRHLMVREAGTTRHHRHEPSESDQPKSSGASLSSGSRSSEARYSSGASERSAMCT